MTAIKDMFDMARAYSQNQSALDIAQNQMKNYLQIENGINKNWQDALQFNDAVAATNALNQFNTQKSKEDLQKLYGEQEFNRNMAGAIYDADTQNYRSPYETSRLIGANLTNPYAINRAAEIAQKSGLDVANNLAAFNPVAAAQIRGNVGAYGGYTPKITQDSTGKVTINNGYYTRELNPTDAGVFGLDNGASLAKTQYNFIREDSVAARDNQYLNNRTNLTADLNLRNSKEMANINQDNWLEQFNLQSAANQAEKQRYYANQLELERLKQKKEDASTNNIKHTDLINMAKLIQENNPDMPIDQVVNLARSALTSDGFASQQTMSPNTKAAVDMFANYNPNNAPMPKTAPPPTTQPTDPNYIKGVWNIAPETRVGAYVLPQLRAETRQEQVARLNAIQEQIDNNLKRELARNPNSMVVRNLQNLQNSVNSSRQFVNENNEQQYFQRVNPIESLFNYFLYNNILGNK